MPSPSVIKGLEKKDKRVGKRRRGKEKVWTDKKRESLSFSLVGEGRAKKEQNVNFSFKVRKRKVLRDRKRERNEGK